MRIATRSASQIVLIAMVVVLALWCSIFPSDLEAQGGQGQNAVCTTQPLCNPTVGTKAFIDASMFATGSDTLCSTIYKILSPSGYSAAVIDARGLPGSTGASMTCAANWTPWNNGTTFLNKPSTILLPAGTILMPTTWVLPNNTTLIGEGDNPGSGTTLQACKSSINTCSFNGTDMIDLGTSILCPIIGGVHVCNSLSVQNLTLDGQGQTINGVVNTNAQAGTYVDHVSLYQILGSGLSVSGSASDSGPYSNITFNTGSYAPTGATACVSINGLAATRGIRGLSCTAQPTAGSAAVLLDSSSNMITDVRIIGFYDGILVGGNANAQSNLLVNIVGDTSCPTCATPINTVHISANHTVTDLGIVGVSNAGGSGTSTIKDDVTSTNLLGTSDPSVALYVLGEQANNGHSRFTTSLNVPTWATGTGAPTASTCTQGSLYSCTGSTGSSCTNNNGSAALWGCPLTSSTWLPIK